MDFLPLRPYLSGHCRSNSDLFVLAIGRPRKLLPPNSLDLIRTLAARGLRETEIAAGLGMSVWTWRRLREEDPDAKRAWAEGRTVEHDVLVGSLMRQATGAPAQYDDAGNLLRAELLPVPGAAMFLLKARHSYRDAGPTDGAAEGRPVINIVIPASLPASDFAKLIEGT